MREAFPTAKIALAGTGGRLPDESSGLLSRTVSMEAPMSGIVGWITGKILGVDGGVADYDRSVDMALDAIAARLEEHLDIDAILALTLG